MFGENTILKQVADNVLKEQTCGGDEGVADGRRGGDGAGAGSTVAGRQRAGGGRAGKRQAMLVDNRTKRLQLHVGSMTTFATALRTTAADICWQLSVAALPVTLFGERSAPIVGRPPTQPSR